MLTAKTVKEALEKAAVAQRVADGETVSLDLPEIASKAATDPVVRPNPGTSSFIVDDDARLATASASALGVRSLIPEVLVSSGSVTVVSQDAWYDSEGDAAVVAENERKAQISPHIASQTYPLQTVACRVRVSAELLEDYGQLAELIYRDGIAAKDQSTMRTILSTINSNAGHGWNVNHNSTGHFLQGVMKICGAGYSPDGVVMVQAARSYGTPPSVEDSTYWLSSYIADSNTLLDANNAVALKPDTSAQGIGLTRTVLSQGIVGYNGTNMTLLNIPIFFGDGYDALYKVMGDFAHGSRIYTRGTKIELAYDADDWSKDLITIRVSERFAFVVLNKYAFAMLTDSKKDGSKE